MDNSVQNSLICGRLKNKVAVVTASSDGIGYAIAERLAFEGASVVVSSRKLENVNRAVDKLQSKGLSVIGVKCHVSDASDRANLFRETVQQFGGLDIFVSNAATNPVAGPVLDCNETVWEKIFDVNVKSSFLLAKDAAPLIRKRGGGGSIIFISSVAGYTPNKVLGAYSVSKTVLLGLTKAIAQDLAADNIRVNCVAPGLVRTNFARSLYESEEANSAALDRIPMRRLADASEIAGVVAFLASSDASYITGETIAATGGQSSRL